MALGGVSQAAPEDPGYAAALCKQADPDTDFCRAGGGQQTPGGGDTGKVSHAGWPAIDGVYWKANAEDHDSHAFTGGTLSDELLGHHGDDTITGGADGDVLWGDWDPKRNGAHQRDRLSGGSGDDFLYASHGRNTMKGGKGKDFLYAYYGHGTIDCGSGRHDTAQVRLNGAYTVRNCETIKHFCQFGSDGQGGCRKPSARARPRPGDH